MSGEELLASPIAARVVRDESELVDIYGTGAPAGLRPVGVAAIMMIRVEAGMIMGDGLEYDTTVSPWECGLGWAVDLDKGDFRGREASLRLREERTERLVSVVLDPGNKDRRVVRWRRGGGRNRGDACLRPERKRVRS